MSEINEMGKWGEVREVVEVDEVGGDRTKSLTPQQKTGNSNTDDWQDVIDDLKLATARLDEEQREKDDFLKELSEELGAFLEKKEE